MARWIDPSEKEGRSRCTQTRSRSTAAGGSCSRATATANPRRAAKSLLTRLLPDGHLDQSFGAGGFARIPGSEFGEAGAVAVEADGDILLAGDRLADHEGKSQCVQVVRLEPDGSLDPSFGEGGVATLFCGADEEVVLSVGPTSTGPVVAIGNDFEIAVAKLRSDGSRDGSFGRHGRFEMPYGRRAHGRGESLSIAPEAVVTPGGKVLLAATGERPDGATRIVATRLLADGRIDRSYGDDGWASTGKATRLTSVQAEGLTLFGGGVLAVATTFGEDKRRGFGAVAFDGRGDLERGFSVDGDCRSPLGEGEILGVVDDDGQAVAVGGPYGSSTWLLGCRSLGR